ncbi:MAG TPA: hypothetical protein VG206_26680 [Terriglobia bacterium]|nr:hypothetical protein [Terriglobia bacterium]
MAEPTLERIRQAIGGFRLIGGEVHLQVVYPCENPGYFTRSLGELIEQHADLAAQVLAEESRWFEAHIPAAP